MSDNKVVRIASYKRDERLVDGSKFISVKCRQPWNGEEFHTCVQAKDIAGYDGFQMVSGAQETGMKDLMNCNVTYLGINDAYLGSLVVVDKNGKEHAFDEPQKFWFNTFGNCEPEQMAEALEFAARAMRDAVERINRQYE